MNASHIVTQNDWLKQQLDSSGIENPLLRGQFQPCNEGFTVQGVDLDGKSNPDSWQIRLMTPGEDGAKYKTKGKQDKEHGVYDAFLSVGSLGDFPTIEDKHEGFFDGLTRKESRESLALSLGQFLIKYPQFPIIITEGAKKACCGLENGYITLSIPGCTMWHKPQSQELVNVLRNLCTQGRPVYIALDADFRNKPDVKREISRLGKVLSERGCDVKICVWELNAGKGMDDFIVNGGDFDEAIKRALMIAQWEKQFNSSQTVDNNRTQVIDGNRSPTPVEFAQKIAETEGNRWRFHNEQKTWREWNGKYWEAIPQEKVGDYIYHKAKSQIKGNTWVKDCQVLLERELRHWQWMPQSQTVRAFSNGVVDMETLELTPHDPNHYNTSIIHRDWWMPDGDPINSPLEALRQYCPHIWEAWHQAMGGDEKKILKLLAVCHAVMTWRFSTLQKFIHLIGRPGTGKGTFSRLLTALVGEENTKSSKLAKLGNDYDIAHWIASQLVILPDEGAKVSDAVLDNLKSLTGGDSISYRQIYGAVASSPFYGTLLMISNDPLFRGETGALKRRLCLIEFDTPIPNRSHLAEQLMMREIPQLTYCALSMSPHKADEVINGLGEYEIPEFQSKQWELETAENSVADFLDTDLIPKVDYKARIKDLYEEYTKFCTNTGQKPVAMNKFSSRLVNASSFVGWDIEKGKDRHGAYVIGVDLREEFRDRDIPTPSEVFKQAEHHNQPSQPSQPDGVRVSTVTPIVTQPSHEPSQPSQHDSLVEPSSPNSKRDDTGDDSVMIPVTTETPIQQGRDGCDDTLGKLRVGAKVWYAIDSNEQYEGTIVRPQNKDEEWGVEIPDLGFKHTNVIRCSSDELEPRL